MRRRKKTILALLLTAATLITACSSPKGEPPMTTPESTVSSTSASTDPTTTPPATSEPIEVPYADGSEITLTNKRDAIGLAVRNGLDVQGCDYEPVFWKKTIMDLKR